MKKLKLTDRQKILYGCIVFVLALIVSVVAFSNAIISMGMKDPGYYDIETEILEDAPNYARSFALLYYLDGSSDEIKSMGQTLKKAYSTVLSRGYKLTDGGTQYDGFVNIATLNAHIGEEMTISREMYGILSDALEKTREGKGYNLFAGALNRLWGDILVLTEPEEFDPGNNADMAARIEALGKLTADLSNFDLELHASEDKYTCRLTVSKAYLDHLRENEYPQTVLDLGSLRECYILSLVRSELEEAGYSRGYLTSATGLVLNLSGHTGNAAYQLYGMSGDGPQKIGTIPTDTGSAFCLIRAFPLTEPEPGYYSLESEGEMLYRHPLVSADGRYRSLLDMACAAAPQGDILAAKYACITMFHCENKEELDAFAAAQTMKIACALRRERNTVYVNTPCAQVISAGENKLNVFGE